ncbi:hypothetical protein OCL06_09515 [Alteromonas sp. ASW11-19]|uniref:Permuted papain-like amidase YaeF/Yiix C92 family enzyme n=1 Tax=Alteromonas salexigens TaxID=2982530 RepID=A0ABT2VP19_9ALTE|nr:hypothetical protein [Alteromonas salexigens]MCU7554835.1 hypothetical protein [Alteromonas salexigens]
MLDVQQYPEVKPYMQPGDVIAFGGKCLFSRWAKLTTRSAVTHVAVVVEQPQAAVSDMQPGKLVVEATVKDGQQGVMTNRLSERIETYQGDIWWLPLGTEARTVFNANQAAFHDFMFAQQDKKYDVLQLFGAAVDFLDEHPWFGRISYNDEDFSSWFCSELIAAGLKTAGVIKGVNASEVTPHDICRFEIFARRYTQLKGKPRPIRGFNSLEATNWGHIA